MNVGTEQYCGCHASPPHMIKEADMALYRAKNGGRNRVKAFLNVPSL